MGGGQGGRNEEWTGKAKWRHAFGCLVLLQGDECRRRLRQAHLNGVRERDRNATQRDIRQKVAQRVHGRQRANVGELNHKQLTPAQHKTFFKIRLHDSLLTRPSHALANLLCPHCISMALFIPHTTLLLELRFFRACCCILGTRLPKGNRAHSRSHTAGVGQAAGKQRTVSLLTWGLGCRPNVHMASAMIEPTPNCTTVQVIGYGKTVNTLLLYLQGQ
jgi:hypothetical protein